MNLNSEHFITENGQIIVLFDAEVYNRELFINYIQECQKSIERYGGIFVFEGFSSNSIIGDYRPRTVLYISKWESIESFNKWWNCPENTRLKNLQKECSDIKVTSVKSK